MFTNIHSRTDQPAMVLDWLLHKPMVASLTMSCSRWYHSTVHSIQYTMPSLSMAFKPRLALNWQWHWSFNRWYATNEIQALMIFNRPWHSWHPSVVWHPMYSTYHGIHDIYRLNVIVAYTDSGIEPTMGLWYSRDHTNSHGIRPTVVWCDSTSHCIISTVNRWWHSTKLSLEATMVTIPSIRPTDHSTMVFNRASGPRDGWTPSQFIPSPVETSSVECAQ